MALTLSTRRARLAALFAILGLILSLGLARPAGAHADTPTYQVTSSDGVYARNAPEQSAVVGYGPGYDANVTYLCYGWGDAVGPYNNSLWYYVSWSGGNTWINDHWLSDPEPANTPVPGVSECGQTTTTPTSTPTTTSPDPSEIANGSDPDQMRCDTAAAGEETLKSIHMTSHGHSVGYAYLRYSSVCQSEWVTVTYNSGYYPDPSVWLQNQKNTDLYVSDYSPWQGKVWTWQFGNMAHQAACGGVQMYYANGIGGEGNYLGWFYIGCA